MKSFRLMLLAFCVTIAGRAAASEVIGKCYRYVEGFRPEIALTIFGVGEAIDSVRYGSQYFPATGTYTNNVLLKNDLLVQESGRNVFLLSRPRPSSWVSSLLSLEFYRSEGNQVSSFETVECFDLHSEPSPRPVTISVHFEDRMHGWPPLSGCYPAHSREVMRLAQLQCQSLLGPNAIGDLIGFHTGDILNSGMFSCDGTYSCRAR